MFEYWGFVLCWAWKSLWSQIHEGHKGKRQFPTYENFYYLYKNLLYIRQGDKHKQISFNDLLIYNNNNLYHKIFII